MLGYFWAQSCNVFVIAVSLSNCSCGKPYMQLILQGPDPAQRHFGTGPWAHAQFWVSCCGLASMKQLVKMDLIVDSGL